ncbi:MAG: hypothetical protein IMY73_05340 [Bacteroidetes bacterium]|nr:hypothetical protein [Bacteroidota bacterium]
MKRGILYILLFVIGLMSIEKSTPRFSCVNTSDSRDSSDIYENKIGGNVQQIFEESRFDLSVVLETVFSLEDQELNLKNRSQNPFIGANSTKFKYKTLLSRLMQETMQNLASRHSSAINYYVYSFHEIIV